MFKEITRRKGRLIVAALVAIPALLLCSHSLGYRVNWSESMPRGIYRLQPLAATLGRGDMVTLCLEPEHPYSLMARERGYLGTGSCPSGLKPLLKYLAGLPGDMVEASTEGISLNGSLISSTVRPDRDSQGRTVPPSMLRSGVIPEGSALVIAQGHAGSFDSRHFGLVPIGSLTKVTPVLLECVF